MQGFTPAAIKKMEEYSWPGNGRWGRHVIGRAVALGFGPVLDANDIWLSSVEIAPPTAPVNHAPAYSPATVEDIEKEHIRRTLEYTDWNKSQAASILQIERSTLDRKIKLYELKR